MALHESAFVRERPGSPTPSGQGPEREVATTIGMIGVLFDQPILIVGAMVTGPDFGPLVAISIALVGRRWRTARRGGGSSGAAGRSGPPRLCT
ncbi:hypothetical protein [Promicromonospora sp. NPDC023987]|uniref:hypothetical protein n=1 Tax=Promicromonospora sp. NPDC023987 TaxID=3155360 RepID=UPI0033C5BCD8